ncbi:helix-turn-helix domain-containing protein [Lactobacillus gallinarum]|uniref:helix-turn-helix domain-containing protein n=1 Tax=Lactobacillus gallinarum TaxID=52242 RepID=UPI000B3AF9EA|nr:helix-turn-helix transcriptional regulator [Lactobacillus gallinarum]OUQ01924.1 hypothetical protein B5E95_00010 [Lactobacillus gallinarum]
MTQNRIKELRKKVGLSQAQLANKIGISNQIISFYENNKREPKIETWQALANFFDVTVPYLQGIDDKPNTGYSKDYIYKQLDDAYKEKWKDPTGQIMGGGFDKTVDAYLKQAKIKKPSKIDKTFWKTNFNFLFDNPNIKRLLTTKDKYNDDDIKLLLEYTIFLNFTTMKQIIDYYNNN